MLTILLIVLSYCIGSIPTSIIFGKVFRGIDVREHGSRNPGATNTFRVLGKRIGITVGLIDIFKGFFCVVFLTGFVPSDPSVSLEVRRILAGLAAISGHVWTVFAGFKGGKGVGTAFGVFLGLSPVPSLIAVVVWVALTFGTGYVSVGSIAAAAVLPASVIILGIVRGNQSVLLSALSVIIGLLVIVRHRSNIVRLMKGEENRFGRRGKQQASVTGEK
ncbi:glycerol-3-phosphate 1-O-acyltransferase PlsY [bacterium]|nr:glycerol-3-phosphate 1-O-acyltransferase PlsY [bacterium]